MEKISPPRLRTIFKMIALAFDMGNGQLIKQVTSYGSNFKISEREVREVLSMPISKIYSTIHSIKQEDTRIIITDPSEAKPPEEIREEK